MPYIPKHTLDRIARKQIRKEAFSTVFKKDLHSHYPLTDDEEIIYYLN